MVLAEEVKLLDGSRVAIPAGSEMVERLAKGDVLLSRSEFDPTAPLAAKVVEEVFASVAAILEVHVGGRQIRTTPLHEFFTCDRGKIPARDLRPGDLLPGHAGGPMPVDRIEFTGKVEPVYNVRVADFHTYFVGSPEWGFSVWAHNIYRMTVAQAEAAQQHAEGLASTPIPEPVEETPGEFGMGSDSSVSTGDRISDEEAGLATELDVIRERSAHGNSLDTQLPAEGYILRDRVTGEPLKYGMTTQGTARYSEAYLYSINARMNFVAKGTVAEMRGWETGQILDYVAGRGERPPYNWSNH